MMEEQDNSLALASFVYYYCLPSFVYYYCPALTYKEESDACCLMEEPDHSLCTALTYKEE